MNASSNSQAVFANSSAAHQEYASNARSSISFQTAKQPQLIFINGCRAKLPSKPIED